MCRPLVGIPFILAEEPSRRQIPTPPGRFLTAMAPITVVSLTVTFLRDPAVRSQTYFGSGTRMSKRDIGVLGHVS
jgi:hypothetical protein